MNKAMKFAILAALAVVAFSAYAVHQGAQGFTPIFIEDVKQRMRDDYAKTNIAVTEISMLRRGPRELVGFVKLKVPGSDHPQQKNCTATMADDKVTSTWSCEK